MKYRSECYILERMEQKVLKKANVHYLICCLIPYLKLLCMHCFPVPDFQEPYAVVVLLEKDLVLIDLAQNG